MDQWSGALAAMLDEGVYHVVLGQPLGKEPTRAVASLSGDSWLIEEFSGKQAFHRTLGTGEVLRYLSDALGKAFAQLNAWSPDREYALRVTKKGRLLSNSKAAGPDAPKRRQGHDRAKRYLLEPGEAIGPLVDMGIMTRDGQVIKAMNGKYRQINRFLELIEDELPALAGRKELHILDLCCGKSYLTFLLYHYLTRVKGLAVRMTGLDLKEQVIADSNAVAQKYGYEQLSFHVADINEYDYPGEVDMVVALHACDTATDYALYNAVRWGAKLIYSVPCCHHEVAAQMQGGDGLLLRYGIVKERTAALLTDALRANLLACCGYKAQLLEFVDIEHTPKNILIRARRAPAADGGRALAQVRDAVERYGIRPTLLRLLEHRLPK